MAIHPDIRSQPQPTDAQQPQRSQEQQRQAPPKQSTSGQASPPQAPQRGGNDAGAGRNRADAPSNDTSGGQSPLHGKPGKPDAQTGSETVEAGAGNGSKPTFNADQQPPQKQQGQSAGPGDGGANDTEPNRPDREARAPTVGPKKSLR